MAFTQTEANKGGLSMVGEDTADTAPIRGRTLGGIQIFIGSGDPNTFVTAAKGSIAIDASTPAVWQNTTGAAVWEKVGTQS